MNPILHYNNYAFILKWELGLLSWYSNGPWAGWPGFDFWPCKIFLFTTMSKLVRGLNQPPIQWVPETLSLGAKRQEREADHSPQSSVMVKNGGATPPLPHMSSWHST
jgi:hypothetical protein